MPKTRKQRWNIKKVCKILKRNFKNKTRWGYGGRRNRMKSWQEIAEGKSNRQMLTSREIKKQSRKRKTIKVAKKNKWKGESIKEAEGKRV